jgi:TolB-like protein/class 3 adenylate cyclase/predicted ATPase/Flp pilus assembly protein TadD
MVDGEISFGRFRFDLTRRELRRDNSPVRLGNRALDILCVLASAEGALVTKDELMAQVWPGVVVEENNLHFHISSLRKALDADGKGESWIVTVPGRGYRLLRASEPPASGKATAEPSAPVAEQPSLAVLPFLNLSGDLEQDYFADGMVEEITTAVSRYPSLFVIARTSCFTYKGRTVEVKRIGRELGARYVLEGSLRKSGNRIRISAQLVEAETGNHLWAERYDRDLADIFAVQDEITQAVAIAIAPAIADAELRRAMHKPPDSLSAWLAYQRGLWHLRKATCEDNLLAVKSLQQAIDLDPTFSSAYAALSTVQAAIADFQGLDASETADTVETLARQAVALDPANSEARALLGAALFRRGDYKGARAEAEAALAISPNLALAHGVLGSILVFSGHAEQGLASLEQDIRLDPRGPRRVIRLNQLALGHYFCREYETAVEMARRVIREFPDYPPSYRWLAAALGQLGWSDEAKEALEKAVAVAPAAFDMFVRQGVPWMRPEDRAHMREGLQKAGLRPANGEETAVLEAPPRDSAPRDVVALQHREAERRQITALCCELVGAMSGGDGVGLEDLREAIGGFQRCVSEIADRHQGFVYRDLGNSALVLFGFPEAHEHDAEQAIRAGLELCAAVRTLRPDSDAPVRCRVGIATGMVIVGEPDGTGTMRGKSIVGDAPNLAARLSLSARADTVVVDPATRHLVGNLFDCRELGALEAAGGGEAIRSWQVLGESIVESRFEALRGSALSPLVGRDEEIDLLLRRWARAKTGNGQVVLVSGEPGIGKSRIAAALEERIGGEPHLLLRYFCSPYHQDSALFPFVDQLAHAAGFGRDDMPAVKWEKLDALLALAAPPDEDVALLADLTSLPASEGHPLPSLSPQRKKDRTLEALTRQLEGSARRQPVVTVFEDAHWIDPTSRELLDLMIERIRTLPVLLIVTFRPEFQPPWTGQEQVSTLALNRLDRHDRTVLAKQIAGGKALPTEVVAQIADRTDGVPLFVEELTKSILESGLLREAADRYVLDGALRGFAIPTTLQASLLARLDRLPSVRPVAQIGAAIGRQFPYALLRAVSSLPEDELQRSLAHLVASELVSQRGAPPEAVYSFKHALVQDAAHDSLLRNARRQLHARIAEALEADFPEITESQPELLAQHYTEAGLVEKSVAYWGKAGHRSTARSAMAEAAAQFQKGLGQLVLLPDSSERQRQELGFLSGLGAALVAVRAHAAPETGQAYARAGELWEQLGSPSEFLHIAYGQLRNHLYRGELDLAQRLAGDLLNLSQRNHSAGLVLGHESSGRNLMFVGSFASARSHLEKVLALYDPISHRSLVPQVGFHPQVWSQAYLGIVLFCLGFPDQALAQSNAAVAEARRLAHAPPLAASLAIGSALHAQARDDAALKERADELVAVTTERGLPFWGVVAALYRGWVKIKSGDAAEGTSLLCDGLSAFRASGAVLWLPYFLAFRAMACEIAGQIEEALTFLDDALQIMERTGGRWIESELNRLKGQLLLRQGHTDAAEELHCKALSIAQEQEAKLWELRAAASLAQLWRDQGRPAKARELLAPVYGWFTEGFESPDLKDAKALLDALDA